MKMEIYRRGVETPVVVDLEELPEPEELPGPFIMRLILQDRENEMMGIGRKLFAVIGELDSAEMEGPIENWFLHGSDISMIVIAGEDRKETIGWD